MKNAKKKTNFLMPLVNPIIDLERLLEKVLKKGEYISIMCHKIPGDNGSGSHETTSPIMENYRLKICFSEKTNYSWA